MNWLATTIGVISTVVALAAHAQPPTTVDDTPPPDPSSLSSDWWKHFENAGDKLADRILLFKTRLRPDEDATSSPGVGETSKIVDEIAQSLDAYAELKKRKPPPPIEAPRAAEHYDLSTILDLVTQIRDLQLEVDLEREEINNRDTAIKQARKRLDNLRAAYFALDNQDPSRPTQGLTIIRDRLRLALAQEELRLLRPQLDQKEQQTKVLNEVLDTASARLVASSDNVQSFQKLYERAEAEVSRLNDEAAFYRLRTTRAAETPVDHAQARRFKQRLIDFDVRIATAMLRRAEARTAAALLGRLAPEAKESEGNALRESVRELEQLLKTTDEQRRTWRRATDGERVAAEAQLSLAQKQNPDLAEIHRGRIEQTEGTFQTLADLREHLAKGQILADLATKQIAREEGRISVWLADFEQSLSAFWAFVTQKATGSLFTINETPVTLLGLLRILVILSIAWWLSKVIRHALDRFAQRNEAINRAALYTTGRLFHYVILTIGIFVGLSSIGLDFTKLALFVSALGVGLGFGLQAIFSNFVAGLIILFERSLEVGDFVELESGVTGEVREINIRSTLITTNDNIDILVPNSEFVNGRVINWTLREAYRRLRVRFGVAYGTDKELVKTAALEAAAAVPYTLTSPANRRPQVWLVEFGDSSLNFELVVWLKPEAVSRPSAVQAAYTWEIETALKKYAIEIPFPQRDLHLRSGFKQLLADSTTERSKSKPARPT